MAANNGILREDEMIFHLNNRKFSDLSDHLQDFITHIFGPIESNTVIKCSRVFGYLKPDFNIYVGDSKVGVSMKSGDAKVVHCEQISTFISFLKENNISNRTIMVLKLFLYGDGTIDGTGKDRLTSKEAYIKYSKLIEDANLELNSNADFICKAMLRFAFNGIDNDENKFADIIYHGSYKEGLYVTKKQFIKHIYRKEWCNKLKMPHIGPFLMNPIRRFPHRAIVTDVRKRNFIQFYVTDLKDELSYINRHYSGYETIYKKDDSNQISLSKYDVDDED